MRKFLVTILIAYFLVAAPALLAGQFASLNGKFRITYPDNWKQLDYRFVDSVLFNGNPYPYEGVFAANRPTPLDQEDYLIITIDTAEKYSERTIDSTLEGWKVTLGAEIKKYSAADDFSVLWSPSEISYWPKSTIASIYTEPKPADGNHTRNQLVVKFYERGSANFYFYGPDSTWAAFQPIINSIVESFSTENIETALSHEQVKVVDVNQLKSRSNGSSSLSDHQLIYILAGSAAVVLIVVFAAFRARRKKSSPLNS